MKYFLILLYIFEILFETKPKCLAWRFVGLMICAFAPAERLCTNLESPGYSAVAENSSMRVWRALSGTNAVLVLLVYAYIYQCACTFFRILYIVFLFFLALIAFIYANNVNTIYWYFYDKIASFEKKNIHENHKIL